jgi:hypothetical protein
MPVFGENTPIYREIIGFSGVKTRQKCPKCPKIPRFRVILGVKWVFFAPPQSRRGVVGGGYGTKSAFYPQNACFWGKYPHLHGNYRFLGGKNQAKMTKCPKISRFRVILGVKWHFCHPPS